MRADRLLSILLLLQIHKRLTTRDLARRLEVSDRTILRDMDALSTAGIPITSLRGASGGWTLVEDYTTNLTGLNPAEIQALSLTGPAHVLADLELGSAWDAALIKLAAALPAETRRNAEYVRQRLLIDVASWHPDQEQAPYLPTLHSALWQDHKVQMTYRRTDGKVVDRIIDPLGLVSKGSAWYLVAACDGEVRTYRVSRVQSVQVLEEPGTRPPGFDLPAYWDQWKKEYQSGMPRYPAVLLAEAGLLDHIRSTWKYGHIDQVEPAEKEGWVRVQITFEVIEEACGYLLSVGPAVQVLAPQELRERVIHLAEQILALY